MTHKIQVSKKIGDDIFVAAGDTIKEFQANYEFIFGDAFVETPTQPQQSGSTKATQTSGGAEEFSCEDSELIAEMRNGKTYWKVTNVPGTQYPVVVWPEVLLMVGWAKEDGVDESGRPFYTTEDMLSPQAAYPMIGMTGKFIRNEKGYPSKIVHLGVE